MIVVAALVAGLACWVAFSDDVASSRLDRFLSRSSARQSQRGVVSYGLDADQNYVPRSDVISRPLRSVFAGGRHTAESLLHHSMGHRSDQSGIRAVYLAGRMVAKRVFPFFGRPYSRRLAIRWRAATTELCHALNAELAAGRAPGDALCRAVSWVEFPDPAALLPVVAAARDGGDVPATLLAAAPRHGGEGFRLLAACWRTGIEAGAGLTALIDTVEARLRAAEAHRQDVAAQLAGPRATVRLLAALPALGLLMGTALGMSPLTFLLSGPAGLACLLTGVTLNACGLWWTHHLVQRAES